MLEGVLVDRSVREATPLQTFQFQRLGYYCLDKDTSRDPVECTHTHTEPIIIHLTFNITISMIQLCKFEVYFQ